MATKMMGRAVASALLVALCLLAGSTLTRVQGQCTTTDGGPLCGLTSQETGFFNQGLTNFNTQWAPIQGLGPVFTFKSCFGCHNSPAAGGGSFGKSTLFGKLNSDGSFNPLTNEGGPLLQSFSIGGQVAGCSLKGETLPADATIKSFRLMPPVMGFGLIDSIPDDAILANAVDQGDGIHGVANMTLDANGNLRPGRFGRKAQFPTVIQIDAAAFGHDIGVTTPLVPTEDLPSGNPIPAGCQIASTPNDPEGANLVPIFWFTLFLAPHQASALSASAQAGQQLFTSIGCAKCHIPTMQTAAQVFVPVDLKGNVVGPSAALSNQPVPLYSDLLLHDMGTGLADNFPQGQATGTQWRTTPLWGISLRSFFLHDGRTASLSTAITSHGGEATTVVNRFKALSATDQSNITSFLKSL